MGVYFQKICFERLSGLLRCLLLPLLLLVLAPADGAAETAFSGAVEEVLADDRYQKELPCITDRETNPNCAPTNIDLEPPGWLKALGKVLEALSPLWPVIVYGFWGLLILGAGYLLYQFVTGFELKDWKLHKKPKKTPRPVTSQVQPRQPELQVPTLPEADALADQEDFSAAVHLLLLAGIDLLQRKLRGLLEASQTSREIVSHDRLTAEDKNHLQPLIDHVEISLFAGRGLTREEYDLCRRNFLALQAGPGGSA